MDYVQILRNIAVELVKNEDQLSIRQLPSLDENTIILRVYAGNDDLSRLIGVRGNMANSMRKLMSVAGRTERKRFDIKFESYE